VKKMENKQEKWGRDLGHINPPEADKPAYNPSLRKLVLSHEANPGN